MVDGFYLYVSVARVLYAAYVVAYGSRAIGADGFFLELYTGSIVGDVDQVTADVKLLGQVEVVVGDVHRLAVVGVHVAVVVLCIIVRTCPQYNCYQLLAA